MYNKIEREVQRFPIYPCPDAQLPPSSATTARVVQLLVTIDEPALTSHHHTGSTVCLRTPFLYHTVYGLMCQQLSRVQLFITPWTVAHQAPLSMRFSRQEYGSGLPFPSPGGLPDRIEHRPPALQAGSLPSEPIWV